MAPRQNSLRTKRGPASSRSLWPLVVGLILLQAGAVSGAEAGGGPVPVRSFSAGQIFTFLFLMLGPFKFCVKSINDIDNNSTVPGFIRPPDPRFPELVELMEKIQRSGAIGTRLVKKDKWEAAMMTFRRRVDPDIARDLAAARRLMGVDPNATETTVIYGSAPTANNEIAVLTRSIMEIIIEMASQIDVPAEHVAEGRTYATLPEVGSGPGQVPPFSRVHTGKEKPAHAFATIRNRGYWYWIDDRDRLSKTHFTFLMVLFSLTETGTPPQAPLITVPVN